MLTEDNHYECEVFEDTMLIVSINTPRTVSPYVEFSMTETDSEAQEDDDDNAICTTLCLKSNQLDSLIRKLLELQLQLSNETLAYILTK